MIQAKERTFSKVYTAVILLSVSIFSRTSLSFVDPFRRLAMTAMGLVGRALEEVWLDNDERFFCSVDLTFLFAIGVSNIKDAAN